MNILLYKSKNIKCKNRLENFLNRCSEKFKVIRYYNMNSLWEALPFNYNKPSIGLFILGTTEELQVLNINKSLFSHLKVILVLPENNHELMKKAFSLSPVHICHTESDFNESLQILEYIAKKYKKN